MMSQQQHTFDRQALDRLADRLKRGIPKWEQEHFLDQVVPQLVETLKKYVKTQV